MSRPCMPIHLNAVTSCQSSREVRLPRLPRLPTLTTCAPRQKCPQMSPGAVPRPDRELSGSPLFWPIAPRIKGKPVSFRLHLSLRERPIPVGREVLPLLRLAMRPVHRHRVDLRRLADPDDVPPVVHGCITTAGLHEPRVRFAAGLDHDPTARDVAKLLPGQVEADPMVVRWYDIAKDHRRLVQIVEHQVRLAVVVEVGDGHPAAVVPGPEIRTAATRNAHELALLIEKQLWKLGPARGRDREADRVAMGDDQIFPAVAVQVQEGGTPTDHEPADVLQSIAV